MALGLPANFTTTQGTISLQGFNGYVRLQSKILSVQRIGDVQGDNRDDIAETETVVGGTGHSTAFGLSAGLVVGLPRTVTVTGQPLSIGTESGHVTRSSVQAQPKTAVIDSGGNLHQLRHVQLHDKPATIADVGGDVDADGGHVPFPGAGHDRGHWWHKRIVRRRLLYQHDLGGPGPACAIPPGGHVLPDRLHDQRVHGERLHVRNKDVQAAG